MAEYENRVREQLDKTDAVLSDTAKATMMCGLVR
jgi:hypothetical protein